MLGSSVAFVRSVRPSYSKTIVGSVVILYCVGLRRVAVGVDVLGWKLGDAYWILVELVA